MTEEAGDAEWYRANRAMWDESAVLHERSSFYDLARFREGRDHLRPWEPAEVGDVADLELLHLQCHLGTDTLSWARRGARVVGLDFSSRAVDVARRLARDCGLEAEFVCADVYDAPAALGGRTFDVVYTGIGAVNWLPDIDRWARTVAALTAPGGILYLLEIHPLVQALADDGRTIAHDMLAAGPQRWDEAGGTYACPDAALSNTVSYERNHAVGEVATALLSSGLRIEALHEHDATNSPRPWLVKGPDGLYRLPEGWPRYPLLYSLRARR
jgi:2-polyprenyl-3-methyl-5-hydroxy-6-metoxy-1,4-benzoquinol methylase